MNLARSTRLRGVGAFLWLLAGLFLLPAANAETTNISTLPIGPPASSTRPHPWSFDIDSSGIDGQAFRAIRITATSRTGPVTSDRSLRVRFSLNGYGDFNYDERVTATIEVPAGATTASVWVNVPQRRQLYQLYVSISEAGEDLEGCSTNVNINRSNTRNYGDQCVGILVIDSDAPDRDKLRKLQPILGSSNSELKKLYSLPDIRTLVAAIPANAIAGPGTYIPTAAEDFSDDDLLRLFIAHEGVDILPPKELTESWLSQSNADVAIISLDDLKKLTADHARFSAFENWVMAGGVVLLYGCGEEWERMPEVAKTFGMRSVTSDTTSGVEVPGWINPQASKRTDIVQGLEVQPNYGYPTTTYTQPGMPTAAEMTPTITPVTPAPAKVPFIHRRYGLGMVVACRSDDPFDSKADANAARHNWIWFWNTVGSEQFLWQRRHGMSHVYDNNDFWNFVIPGVGEAPVFSFMFMIAIFMLLIGPLNYYLLQRWRRLSLMLVTVPIGAGVFTFGLFMFAAINDGFSTRVRVRSLTVLEPAAGKAATISRQTYYMAFVPSGGMRYPADTAVYPLHAQPGNESARGHAYLSDSQWVGNELRLQRRYLTARQHRQFIAVRATDSPAKLDVKRSAPGGLEVTNSLGVEVTSGVLVDEKGQLYEMENLAAGAQERMTAGDGVVLRAKFSKLLHASDPALPPHFDPNAYDTMFTSRNRYYRNYSQQGVVGQNYSVLERGLRDAETIINTHGSAGNANYEGSGIRSFIVFTKEPINASDGQPMAPLGIEKVDIVQSFHVTRGSW